MSGRHRATIDLDVFAVVQYEGDRVTSMQWSFAPPTRIAELASLQRYTALPDGWRQVAEDQHIAESSYPHPAPMVRCG